MVVPGLYGFVSATKWVVDLELTTFDDFDAYWARRGWAKQAPIKTQSRIDVPKPLARIAAGSVAVGGVAWAQHRGIEAVEVRVDEGPWQRGGTRRRTIDRHLASVEVAWDATPGNHRIEVRATDATGAVQPARACRPHPGRRDGMALRRGSRQLISTPIPTGGSRAMFNRSRIRVVAARVAAVALTLTAAACGGDDDSANASDETTATSAAMPSDADGNDVDDRRSTDDRRCDHGASPFGPACSSVPTEGAGSFDGMADDPVATAASNNPLLSTLVSAVTTRPTWATRSTRPTTSLCSLRRTAAFDALTEADARRGAGGPERSADDGPHVPRRPRAALAGCSSPATIETLQGADVTVEGSGEDFTVNGTAKVVCGNVQTANATVYIIDGVLMPTPAGAAGSD